MKQNCAFYKTEMFSLMTDACARTVANQGKQ